MTRPTLPGTIAGLLRRGSPVVCPVDVGVTAAAVVVSAFQGGATFLVATSAALREERATALALDLTDPTGRAHAAWWLTEQDEDVVGGDFARSGLGRDPKDVASLRWRVQDWVYMLTSGCNLTDAQIDALRRVVLAVAGLEVSDAE